MQDYGQQSSRPAMDDHMLYTQGRDLNNGIIMVESNPHAATASQKNHQQVHQTNENSNVNSNNANANKKKSKKKKSKGDGNDGSSNKLNQQQQSNGGGERMVTLKNPMFFSNNATNNGGNLSNNTSNTNNGNSETMMSMMRNLQTPPFISPMNDPQQASIIKNENGMYTIRNPAFNAFGAAGSAGMSSSVGNYMNNQSYITHSSVDTSSSSRPYNMPYESDCPVEQQQQQPKCSSVIGSEMKNVLQRRKEQEYAHMDPYNQYGMRSQYSHFGGSGVPFNQNNAACDENFMHRSNNYQSYPSMNYDDLRLQPGKMLNSEVSSFFTVISCLFVGIFFS